MEWQHDRPKSVFSLMSNITDSTYPIKLCFWNMNGVRNKFSSETVISFIGDFEILVVIESHFNVRSKCPDNFTLVGRSKPTAAKSPRGGVAVYKSNTSNLIIDVVSDSLPDCVVFELRNSTALFIACYIPPRNSAYYSDAYFNHLIMACESFLPRRDVYGGRDGSLENLKEDGIKKIRNEKIYKKILDEMAHLKQ